MYDAGVACQGEQSTLLSVIRMIFHGGEVMGGLQELCKDGSSDCSGTNA